MAKIWSRDLRFYFAAYDPGTATVNLTVRQELDALDKTSLGDAAESFVAGLRRDSMTWSGLFDNGTLALNAAAALVGTVGEVVSVLVGTATGNRAFCGTAAMLSLTPGGNSGELVRHEASFKPDGSWDAALHFGPRMAYNGSAGPGTSGSIDNGTDSTAGGVWYLHVFAPTGTWVFALSDSADGTTYANQATALGTAATAIRVALTGTIDQYTKISAGGTTTATAFAALRRS